jgi:hypothetical protein
MQVTVQRDSGPWQMQVWVSFGLAILLCSVGLAYLPGKDLDRVFMIMGYFFCLSNAFVLAKFVRDNQPQLGKRPSGRAADTPLFRYVIWGGFMLAMGLTGWGLLRMEISETYKAFLGVCWLYLITCAFTLAKMLRDRHEADLLEGRIAPSINATE